MSDEVATRIREAIADHGPITFAEYMEHALYGPGGFYERPPVGEHGHFVTNPHIHPVFADLVRFALGELRDALGDPDPFTLLELGAGDGTLAGQLLASHAEVEPTPVDYAAVEISPGARHALTALGLRVAERIEDLPRTESASVFANELLDNLPFRRVRATDAGSVEVRVGVADDGALVGTEAALDDELAALTPETLERGKEAVIPIGALTLVDRLAAWMRRGYVLLIDYGAEGPGAAGEVHGYRGHRVLADVLADPGVPTSPRASTSVRWHSARRPPA